jgi:hypothetical protein
MDDLPKVDSTGSSTEELEKRIERQIVLATWGRIHNLEVEVTASKIVVRGRTPSHYVKQLVLQAVFDVLGPTASIPVELNIQVGQTGRHALPGDNDQWGVPRF